MPMETTIKVVARVRPILTKECVLGLDSRLKCSAKSIFLEGLNFTFDQVFHEVTSDKIYHDCAHEIVLAAMDGYHGTIMTYGQTCSGKTFTVSSLREKAMKAVFSHIESSPAREFLLRISYVELYNEKFQDLLGDSGKPLTLREDLEKNVFLSNCTEKYITSASDVAELLRKGDEKRQVAETAMNDASSRSHVIFRLVIESRLRGSDIENSGVFVSNLNIIDLAGSEKTSENLNSLRFKEGCNINKSLMTLATVIRKLSEQETFIPFRDSKLTRYLQNSLGGNSKTTIILTISPTSVEETLSTLQFGQSAKKIKNRPQKNEVITDEAELKKSLKEIERLKECIRQLESSQAKEELEAQRKKKQILTEELGSVLCVSSRNRRQTVCVPQLSRFKPIIDISPVKSTVTATRISMPLPNLPAWSPSKFDEISLPFEEYERHFIREAAFQKLYARIQELQEQIELLKDQQTSQSLQNTEQPSLIMNESLMAYDGPMVDFSVNLDGSIYEKLDRQFSVSTNTRRQTMVSWQDKSSLYEHNCSRPSGMETVDEEEEEVSNRSTSHTHSDHPLRDSATQTQLPNVITAESTLATHSTTEVGSQTELQNDGHHIENLMSEINYLTQSLSSAEEELILTNEILKDKEETLYKLTSQSTFEESTQTELLQNDEHQNENLMYKIDHLTLSLSSAEKELKLTRGLLKEKEDKLFKLTSHSTVNEGCQTQLTESDTEQNEILMLEIESLTRSLLTAEEELKEANENADLFYKTLEDRNSELDKADNKVQSLMSEINHLTQSLSSAEEELKLTRGLLKEKDDNLFKLSHSTMDEGCQTQLTESDTEQNEILMTQIDSLTRSLSTAEEELKEAKENADLYYKTLEERNSELDKADNKVQSLMSEINHLTHSLSSAEEELKLTRGLLKEKDDNLFKLSHSTMDEGCQTQLTESDTEQNEILMTQIDSLTRSLSTAEEELKEANENADLYYKTLEERNSELDEAVDKVESLMEEVAALERKISWGKDLLAQKNQRIEEMEQKYEKLDSEFKILKENIRDKEGVIKTLNLEKSSLTKKVTGLQESIEKEKEYYMRAIDSLKRRNQNQDGSFIVQRPPEMPELQIRRKLEFEFSVKMKELENAKDQQIKMLNQELQGLKDQLTGFRAPPRSTNVLREKNIAEEMPREIKFDAPCSSNSTDELKCKIQNLEKENKELKKNSSQGAEGGCCPRCATQSIGVGAVETFKLVTQERHIKSLQKKVARLEEELKRQH